MEELNVVYIGSPTFPIGGATSKRRRYMIDYMNNHNIQSHYLICDFKQRGKPVNKIKGTYGFCNYYDITHFASNKNYIKFWNEGKRYLLSCYNQNKKNILIFATSVSVFEYPFYVYAKKIGYKIICDQVETSYLENGRMSWLHKINIKVSEWISDKVYKNSAAFVISKNLYNEVHRKYPNRKLCLLQNSTPQLSNEYRRKFNNPIQILYSGTYSNKDGVKYLLEGVIEAYDAGCKLELILLGKGTNKDMEVLNIAKGKEYIKYLGFVSDEELNKYLLNSDILCMTRSNSRFANYGFPFKLSEYLATGNIVLATNVGDVCDYIEDKKSAYIVSPENSHSIAKTILHIHNNPEEAFTVAKGGLEAMQEHFSIENVGKIFINFLRTNII